jgi:hypothetical protein
VSAAKRGCLRLMFLNKFLDRHKMIAARSQPAVGG